MPPWQCASGGGRSGSALSLASIPHEPWFLITLPVTVSYEPPAICTPVPTGGAASLPGVFALLFARIRLSSMIVQDLVALPGQRPSCGDGASSLFIEFGARPARLSRNTEFLMTSCPPELVPEYPSAELTPVSLASVVSQTRRHAPTYQAASAMLLA